MKNCFGKHQNKIINECAKDLTSLLKLLWRQKAIEFSSLDVQQVSGAWLINI